MIGKKKTENCFFNTKRALAEFGKRLESKEIVFLDEWIQSRVGNGSAAVN